MALARGRREVMNYWPGFVDALSTLLLGIIFMLTVFVVVQFFLSQEVTGKTSLEETIAQLRASLSGAESERDRIKGLYEGLSSGANTAQSQVGALNSQIESEKRVSARALAQVELLNQQISALRRQLSALEAALDLSEKRDKDAQTRIADLGQRLNLALAQRVQELSRYRSEFFGRLHAILGNRPDIRVVGDRFVFQSEVFFDSGSAAVRPEGLVELDKLAGALLELEKQIPKEIAWVLRIDGHTDVRPIVTAQFPSNWALSSARAISVVQYLIAKGISPQRLVAAGFGEFQPLDNERTEDAYRRNRRIELKLTER